MMHSHRLATSVFTISLAALPFIAYAQSASCPVLSRTLSYGARGGDVASLQQFFISQGLLAEDSATGFFGEGTLRAIQQWQASHGIVSNGAPATTGYGMVGAKTRAAIMASCGSAAYVQPVPAQVPPSVSPSTDLSGIRSQISSLQDQVTQLSNRVNGLPSGSGTGTTGLTGLSTSQVAEGSNLYYTDNRVAQYINASSTIAAPAGGEPGSVITWNGSKWVAAQAPGAGASPVLSGGAAYSQIVTNGSGSLVYSPILDAAAFGAVGNITSDNAAAFAAISAAAAAQMAKTGQDGVQIRFPCGRFRSSAPLFFETTNNKHITIQGGGSHCTTLYFDHSDGIAIHFSNQYVSAAIKDMSLVTNDTSATPHTAIHFYRDETVQAYSRQSTISGVVLQGYDALGGSHYWGTGFFQDKVSYVDIDNFQYSGGAGLRGIAIKVQGDSSRGNYSVVTNISKAKIDVCDKGIYYGSYYQGMAVNAANIVNCSYGIYMPPGTAAVDQMSVTNSQFNNVTASIALDSAMLGLQVSNSLFITRAGAYGIRVKGLRNSTIVGNSFQVQDTSHTGTGIEIGTSGDPGEEVAVAANSFNSIRTGISILDGASANTTGNSFWSVQTPYLNVSPKSYQANNIADNAPLVSRTGPLAFDLKALPPSPNEGMCAWDKTVHKLACYDGSAWQVAW